MEVFQAVLREGKGKGEARKLRRQGYIPAVIYGGDLGNKPLAVLAKSVIKHLKGEVSEAKIWKLNIDGVGEKGRHYKGCPEAPCDR